MEAYKPKSRSRVYKDEAFLKSDLWPFGWEMLKERGNLSILIIYVFIAPEEVSGPFQLGDASTNASGKKLMIMEDSTLVLLTENIIHAHQSASRKSA